MEFRGWDRLLYGVQQQECILFLGPQLPLVSADGERSLPVQTLADRLLARLNGDGASVAGRNVSQIAQRVLAREDEGVLEMEVTRWHEGYRDQQSVLHDALASLPFRWIITSGHDPLMQAALTRAGKTPTVGRYHYRGMNDEMSREPTDREPALFHLYGHAAEPTSLVLAETQLLDFLTGLISRDPPLPNDVNAALSTGRLFLFLGFGLQHWYLRILLRVLKVLRRGSRSFAFEPLPTSEVAQDAVLFYRENFKVEVHDEDVAAFAQSLRRRFEASTTTSSDEELATGPSAAVPAAPISPGTTVFLCHASKDAEKAREIHDALKQAGLNPWLDREALRGGDRWDSMIETTIHGVDFFLVLNSHALVRKSQRRAYVVKEIKVALEEDKKSFGKFIIPVKIDEASLLEPLTDFHAVDLTTGTGLRDLIRAIKRQTGGIGPSGKAS
jgi:hypothetical protein